MLENVARVFSRRAASFPQEHLTMLSLQNIKAPFAGLMSPLPSPPSSSLLTCGLSRGQPGRSDAERQEQREPERAPQSRHSSGRRGETQSSEARLRQHPPCACCPAERPAAGRPQKSVQQQLPVTDLERRQKGRKSEPDNLAEAK